MTRIRDLRLAVKLGCAIALMIGLFATAGIAGVVLSQRAETHLREARALEVYTEDARLLVQGMQLQRALQAEYLASPSPRVMERFRASGTEASRLLDRLASRFAHDPLVRDAVAEARRIDAEHDPLITTRYAPAVRAGRIAEATALLRRAVVLIRRFERVGDTVRAAVARDVDARQASAVAEIGRARRIQLLLGLIATLLTVTLGALVTRSVTIPVGRLLRAVRLAADGDLTARSDVRSRDEVGRTAQSFDAMLAAFRDIVRSAADAAGALGRSASNLAATSAQAGNATAEVAASIDVIARSAEQQAVTTGDAATTARDAHLAGDDVVHRADSAQAAAAEADRRAATGADAVRAVVDSMGLIEGRVTAVHTAVDDLRRDGEAIGRITHALTGIVDQTELLALNAAIEAARAGDAGRGFAVVAAEVRALAVEAERSAQDIAELVQRMQQGTRHATELADRGREDVAEGVRRVADADRAFTDIRSGIAGMAGDLAGVTQAAVTVRSGIAVLDEGAVRLGEMAHSNAAAAQEVSAASEETGASGREVAATAAQIARQAARLTEVVDRFRID